MGLKPVIGGGGGYVQVPDGVSGSSSPGLPVWTYTAGAMATGLLKTDHASPASTTSISLSFTTKNGQNVNSILGELVGVRIIFTSSTGKPQIFKINTAVSNVAQYDFDVLGYAVDATAWAGDYQVSLMTPAQLGDLLSSSGITPCPDGTVTPVTSITTQAGIITAIS